MTETNDLPIGKFQTQPKTAQEVARETVDKITQYSIVNSHGQLSAKEDPDFKTWRNIIARALELYASERTRELDEFHMKRGRELETENRQLKNWPSFGELRSEVFNLQATLAKYEKVVEAARTILLFHTEWKGGGLTEAIASLESGEK